MMILDGPMGTELRRRGVETPAPGWSAYALESHPEIVQRIHEEYVAAGARLHRGNTFRAQPKIFPERHAELCRRAYELLARASVKGKAADASASASANANADADADARARAGAGARARADAGARAGAKMHARARVHARMTLGSMAPIEDCYRPYLSPAEPVARAAHRKMAIALRDAGFDQIVCETFPHAGEARIAVEEAVRTGLVTWVALTAGPDGSLMSPSALAQAARECAAAGASAVMVCCTSATKTLAYVEKLAAVGVPFGAYANAGDAASGLGWDAEPKRAAAAYADLASEWIASGASIVGSCCGTGPAHIAELAARFD